MSVCVSLANTHADVSPQTLLRYSQKAKELLAFYDISPAPKIIELNMRSDGPQVQGVLKRLTGRSTVPNVLVKVRSAQFAS